MSSQLGYVSFARPFALFELQDKRTLRTRSRAFSVPIALLGHDALIYKNSIDSNWTITVTSRRKQDPETKVFVLVEHQRLIGVASAWEQDSAPLMSRMTTVKPSGGCFIDLCRTWV